MKELKLSDKEKKELLDFEDKFANPGSAVFWRAKLISAPYYELIRPEKFTLLDAENDYGRTSRGRNSDELDEVKLNTMCYVQFYVNQTLECLIEKQGVNGYDPKEIYWMTQDGVSLQEHSKDGEFVPQKKPPVQGIVNGDSLIAVLPDGKVKEFSYTLDEAGRVQMNEKERLLSAHMDRYLPGEVADLSMSLAQMEHWYIRSSKEFKDIQSNLETIQKEWKNPPYRIPAGQTAQADGGVE